MKRDDILFIKEILRNLLFLSQQVTESPCCTFLVTAASPPWAYLCPISAVIDLPTTHETFSLILQSDLKVTAKICSLSGTNSITSVEALIPNLLSIGQPAQLPDYNTFITSLITTSSVKITIHNSLLPVFQPITKPAGIILYDSFACNVVAIAFGFEGNAFLLDCK